MYSELVVNDICGVVVSTSFHFFKLEGVVSPYQTWLAVHIGMSESFRLATLSCFVLFFFLQRGFFSLPEGHFFIEPVQKSLSDPAGVPEPHVVYPRSTKENQRRKRSLEAKQTPGSCGVQGVSFTQF